MACFGLKRRAPAVMNPCGFRFYSRIRGILVLAAGLHASSLQGQGTINLPPNNALPDVNIGVRSNTQVNVNAGGVVNSYSFGNSNGSVQNVQVFFRSGSIGNSINFHQGSSANILDGATIDGASGSISVHNGAVVRQLGGDVLAGIPSIGSGATYTISGGRLGYHPHFNRNADRGKLAKE